MQDSVLNIGEKIVLAARLAAIEHVRQELEAARQAVAERDAILAMDRPMAFKDEPEAPFTKPVPTLLAEYFRSIERRAKASKPAQRPRRAEAA